jgi:AraC-like DNA-binding protein
MAGAVIRSQIAPIFLGLVRARGFATDGLFERYGLAPDADQRGDVSIPLDKFREFCDEAAELLGDPFLGLHTAIELPRGAYGLIEFVFRSAPTVREALDHLVRFAPLVSSVQSFSSEVHGDRVTCGMSVAGEPLGLGRHANEFSLALFTKVGRQIAGYNFLAHEVAMCHPRPPDVSEIGSYFGTDQLIFDAPMNSLELDASILDVKVPTADDALYAVLEKQAQAAAARINPADDLEPVREKIRELLKSGEPAIERVAQMLGTSTRTLQRRLGDKNTSFRAITDDVRRALATVYLDDHCRPLTEVAYLLGYSDLRAFARAYKRWTGHPPGAARRQMHS